MKFIHPRMCNPDAESCFIQNMKCSPSACSVQQNTASRVISKLLGIKSKKSKRITVQTVETIKSSEPMLYDNLRSTS